MYLFHILIHVLISYTHSRILIHILIHILISYTNSYTHSHTHSCAHFIYSFTYSFMCSFHIFIHILIHILIHVFISYTHSYTHSRILIHILIHIYSFIYSFTYTHSCISYHLLSFFFWLYVIIIIYNLTTLCVHDKLPFMFIFMFQFVFIFHITFMFHEHIYKYCISCLYLHPFLPCIPINFNQAISTLGTTIKFQTRCGHQMPLNNIWLDSRLNELSIESKNTHNGVLTKELCKLQAVKKINYLQHLQ